MKALCFLETWILICIKLPTTHRDIQEDWNPWNTNCVTTQFYSWHTEVICYKVQVYFWCDFDHASSLICGNKMPTRCNRGFYCRSYCLLNMFRAPLCQSSGAQEYYTVVAACCISCCGFQVAGLMWSWGLCVRFAGCWRPATWKPQHEILQAATTV